MSKCRCPDPLREVDPFCSLHGYSAIVDEYPEDHSPYCPKSCDHPCHDAYDLEQERRRQAELDEAAVREFVVSEGNAHPCCNMSITHNHSLTCPSRKKDS